MTDFPNIDLATTICAIATPIGRGGLGIVRLSGPSAIATSETVFAASDGKRLSDHRGFTVHHGFIRDPESDQVIDEVLATVFRKPRSFTGEDMVEFSAHGGPTVLRRINELLAETGANPATPGEFTLRAFLNGRIDLTEAEAVADIINAKTQEAAQAAAKQIQGALYQQINVLREELISALARLEMGIDFTEEDLDPQEVESVGARLVVVKKQITKLKEGYNRGRILRDGFTVVLAGPPNAGKSTLFNRLAQDERAIVTEIPGTTRDVLREFINIEGWPVCIVDTAGIRQATDLIEQIGVERSDRAIKSADGAIWLIDGVNDANAQKPPELFRSLKSPWALAVNKIDEMSDPAPIIARIAGSYSPFLQSQPGVFGLSAKTGEGVEDLIHAVKGWINQLGIPDQSASIAINDRHHTALLCAEQSIDKALAALSERGQVELVAFDAKEAADALGEIIGSTTTDDILGDIFSKFCVGK